ncbi:hypothetical protein TGVEG_233380 [Toxoplasma gondii VEG]|uniref:Uncharacterized protein n=1 Tax=Toxoplasma gondii (strain ATCC 50861 / VEG) TaxID=432359 RepID=B9Q4G9_TOXGV|nr:hypothetical protein TGVEG_233380 [Toxoplasma gondii VEG]CEL75001.1 TPA: hypothetical protein BN1205_022160 [Toxoplasma gondii VEG]
MVLGQQRGFAAMMQGSEFMTGTERSFPLADGDYPFSMEPPSPTVSDVDGGAVTPTGPPRSFIPLLSNRLSSLQADVIRVTDTSGPCEQSLDRDPKHEFSPCHSESFLLQETSPFTPPTLSDSSDTSWLDLRHPHSLEGCPDADVGFGLLGVHSKAPGVLELLTREGHATSVPVSQWGWSGGSADVTGRNERRTPENGWQALSGNVSEYSKATPLTEQRPSVKMDYIQGQGGQSEGTQLSQTAVGWVTDGGERCRAADVSPRETTNARVLSEYHEPAGMHSGGPNKTVPVEFSGSVVTASTQPCSTTSSPQDWSPVVQMKCSTFSREPAADMEPVTASKWGQVTVDASQGKLLQDDGQCSEQPGQGLRRITENRCSYGWQTQDPVTSSGTTNVPRLAAAYHQVTRSVSCGPRDEQGRLGQYDDGAQVKINQISRFIVAQGNRIVPCDYGRDVTRHCVLYEREAYESGGTVRPTKASFSEVCISPSSLTRSTTATSLTGTPPEKVDTSWMTSSSTWSETDSEHGRGIPGCSREVPSGRIPREAYSAKQGQALPGGAVTGTEYHGTDPMWSTVISVAAQTRHVQRATGVLWNRNEGPGWNSGGRWDLREPPHSLGQFHVNKSPLVSSWSVTGIDQKRENVWSRQCPEHALSVPPAIHCSSFVVPPMTSATPDVAEPADDPHLGQQVFRPIENGRYLKNTPPPAPFHGSLRAGSFVGHFPYAGRCGEANAFITKRGLPIGHSAQAAHNTANGTSYHQYGETAADRVETNSQILSGPACMNRPSESSLGSNTGRDYFTVCSSPSASESIAETNPFTVRCAQQFGINTNEMTEATLKNGYESNVVGSRCGTDVVTATNNKRARLDSEGITFLNEGNLFKKTRRTAGERKEMEDNKAVTQDSRATPSVFPEMEAGDWHTLAPEAGECCGEGSERFEDDSGGQGDEDSNLQWHEGFTLPLGKDGRGELIKRMRSVHKADREFCRFSLEGMGIDFKRLAHATVEELWKIAYRWGLFGYAVKLSKKYGKTTTSQSRKKNVQAAPVPNLQAVSVICDHTR